MNNINVLIVDDDEHSLLLSLRAMEQLMEIRRHNRMR